VNVWDYDSKWKVEWFEDGKPMGKLKPVEDLSPNYIMEILGVFEGRYDEMKSYKYPRHNKHYFAATPSQYAKTVTIAVESRFGKKWVHTVNMSDYVDVQCHRGGMGLMPENTIEAMKNALDMGVNTLELDLQLSKDGVVVVSHDAYFHYRYATRPEGTPVQKGEPQEFLYKYTYDEIAKYDVGSKANPEWPERKCFATKKPTLEELLDFVEGYTKKMGYSPVRYNIEIKSREADGEGINWPIYHDLVDACAKVLLSRHLADRLVVQCFDVRALNFMHEKYPEFKLSYLTGAKDKDFDKFMAKLKFVPEWLSPHYTVVDEALVQKCREKGMKIVPWTVDQPEDLQRMIDLGVDAIITNYPDRLLKLTRGYAYPAPGPFPHR
jgi:glycerophosphoryl diester phosphodiesterase